MQTSRDWLSRSGRASSSWARWRILALFSAAAWICCVTGHGAAQQPGPSPAPSEQELRRAVSSSLNSLGVFYHEKQQPGKAIETLEEALKYDPGNADIRTNLAMLYLQQQQFEKVLAHLEAIPNLDERDSRALTGLAVCNFVLGRYEKAALYYRKLARLQPNDLELVLTLAVVLNLNGQEAESEKVRRGLPENPRVQAQYHVILADAHRFRARLPQALAEYEKAISIAPDLPMVNYRLGVLQNELHENARAVESFRRELKINPDDPDANYSLGAFYLGDGNDAAKAKEHFEKTLKINGEHLGAYLGLMKICLNTSRAADALQLAAKAEGLGAENDEFHYLKSRAYNLLGQRDKAEAELKIFEELTQKKNQ